MRIRAKESFAGAISMYKGQETECNDEVVLQDLLDSGYVEEVKEEVKEKVKEEKTATKGGKDDEGK